MTKSDDLLFELIMALNNNQIKRTNQVDNVGYLVLYSDNYLLVKNYLFSISWNSINEHLLIELIKVVITKQDKKMFSLIINKLYQLQKYNVIEEIYNGNDELKSVIVNSARKFIVSNYHTEDVYDEYLDAKIFLGILCDKEANDANIERSFELNKHIKPKKYIKTHKNV